METEVISNFSLALLPFTLWPVHCSPVLLISFCDTSLPVFVLAQLWVLGEHRFPQPVLWAAPRLCERSKLGPEPELDSPSLWTDCFLGLKALLKAASHSFGQHGQTYAYLKNAVYSFVCLCYTLSHSEFAPLSFVLYCDTDVICCGFL